MAARPVQQWRLRMDWRRRQAPQLSEGSWQWLVWDRQVRRSRLTTGSHRERPPQWSVRGWPQVRSRLTKDSHRERPPQ
jgi:hypothetical protein